MKAGSFVKNKDGTLSENDKDHAMSARTGGEKKEEAAGVKAKSGSSGKN